MTMMCQQKIIRKLTKAKESTAVNRQTIINLVKKSGKLKETSPQ